MNDRSASQAHLFNRVYTHWKIVSDPAIPDLLKPGILRQRLPENNYLHCQQIDTLHQQQERKVQQAVRRLTEPTTPKDA